MATVGTQSERVVALIEHAECSIQDVENGRVELVPGLLDVGGLCSLKVRQLFQRLAQRGVLQRYLEIGVLHGATTCCALTGDLQHVTGLDNFSQFNGQRDATWANLQRWKKPDTSVELVAADLFTKLPDGPFDWYYYDADHGYEATARAMEFYLPTLADPFLLMVDDYDWDDVRRGVQDGLAAAGLQMEWSWHLPSTGENSWESWWNGVLVAVVSRA